MLSWATDSLMIDARAQSDIRQGVRLEVFGYADRRATSEELARMHAQVRTAMELVIEDDSRVDTIYFLKSEDNVRRQIAQPWMAFGSDAATPATEGVFLKSNPHPRTYGNVARLLGHYVREERVAMNLQRRSTRWVCRSAFRPTFRRGRVEVSGPSVDSVSG